MVSPVCMCVALLIECVPKQCDTSVPINSPHCSSVRGRCSLSAKGRWGLILRIFEKLCKLFTYQRDAC